MTRQNFSFQLLLKNETATLECGRKLAQLFKTHAHCLQSHHPKAFPCIIFLKGQLGAGKTTLVRGLLQGLGYQGFVKSPSYTLIEIYSVMSWTIVHLDLYRVVDLSELEYIDLSHYLEGNSVLLVEWPLEAMARLFPPLLTCHLSLTETQRFISIESPFNFVIDLLKKAFSCH